MLSFLIGAILIGLTLGLIGSGGSAITVPVLVYLVGHSGKVSIAESMAIVGIISLVAAVPYGRKHEIDWRSVIYFGIPGMLGTYIGSWLGGLANELIQLVFFGIILLVAATAMLRRTQATPSQKNHAAQSLATPSCDAEHSNRGTSRTPVTFVLLEGLVVGVITGFVGVGGGFLIVPALVILGKLPMRLAIGTSLVIIAAKSSIGFWKYQHDLTQLNLSVDFNTIAIFASIGILGSVVGRLINTHLNQAKLQTLFAIFLIAIGSFVIAKEGHKLVNQANGSTLTVNTVHNHNIHSKGI